MKTRNFNSWQPTRHPPETHRRPTGDPLATHWRSTGDPLVTHWRPARHTEETNLVQLFFPLRYRRPREVYIENAMGRRCCNNGNNTFHKFSSQVIAESKSNYIGNTPFLLLHFSYLAIAIWNSTNENMEVDDMTLMDENEMKRNGLHSAVHSFV